MVAVVDYGMGNLRSVGNALTLLGADWRLAQTPDDLRAADRIILPGVGAFGECVANLRASGLVDQLVDEVLGKRKPFFGICVGMQILATEGFEMGRHAGLGWVPGVVERFAVADQGLKVPHVGWNDVQPCAETSLFAGLGRQLAVYFTHSYHVVPTDSAIVAARADYGGPFVAAILRGNIFATQFHPEKSQQCGLRLLENFLDWEPNGC